MTFHPSGLISFVVNWPETSNGPVINFIISAISFLFDWHLLSTDFNQLTAEATGEHIELGKN